MARARKTDENTENVVPLRPDAGEQPQVDDQAEELEPDSDHRAEAEEPSESQSRSRGPALNRVELIGRIAKGPELRVTHTGMHLVYFRVATNGRDERDTEFHQCTAFGKTAEFIGEYLTTGRLVFLDGRLQTRAYDDPDGVRRWATTIVVNRLQVLDHRWADQQVATGARARNSGAGSAFARTVCRSCPARGAEPRARGRAQRRGSITMPPPRPPPALMPRSP